MTNKVTSIHNVLHLTLMWNRVIKMILVYMTNAPIASIDVKNVFAPYKIS